jgi:hypothetical protein
MIATVPFFVALQPKKKKKAMAMLLSSPSLVHCNQNTKKEGHNNIVATTFFGALQPKKKSDDNIVVVAFFGALQPKKKKRK